MTKETDAAHIPPRSADVPRPFVLLIEKPQSNESIDAPWIAVEGVAFAAAGIERIVVQIGEVTRIATFGLRRPDLERAFPAHPQLATSGYACRIARQDVRSAGAKARDATLPVRVIATACDGEEKAVETRIVLADILFHIDTPQIVGGAAAAAIEGSLLVEGWALARDGIADIVFEIDGRHVGAAYCGVRREDVAQAHSEFGRENALSSGFAFSLPHRALTAGRHRVEAKISTKSGSQKTAGFDIEVAPISEQPGPWSVRERIPLAERRFAARLFEQFALKPRFHIWINCNDDLDGLAESLGSIASQTYPLWDIILSGDVKNRHATLRMIRARFPKLTARMRFFLDAAAAAEYQAQAHLRDLVLPIDAGDILAVDALFEIAVEINTNGESELLYADERRYNVATDCSEAFFKPDWSPTLLLSSNYIGRPWCATLELLERTARPLFQADHVGNFDLLLHCTEHARAIGHVRKVLAGRGRDNLETEALEMEALENAFERRGLQWSVAPGLVRNTYRCRPKVENDDLVSIIIPTCAARGLIKTCIESLRSISTYRNLELIIIDNILDETSDWKQWLRANADVVVEIQDTFNWSEFNNIAAREAAGSYLLFLNDDIEVVQPDWLEAMLDQARREDVAAVGPQLLYPDRKVQHAGMFLGGPGVGRHAFRFCAEDEPGYFGLALTQRDVIAVTGACMLVKAETFWRLGGFDERQAIVNNDLDFCLKAHEHKLRCVYTPFAQLIHHEQASRRHLEDGYDVDAFARWSTLAAEGDPYFHPYLDKESDNYRIDPEPAEVIFATRPLFDPEEIRRILVVKVDHIGDFVVALPAFRRLKESFPNAELVALVAPASQQLAELEPSIGRVIAFEFFHARSQLGQKEVTEDALNELRQELAPFAFDLAIDLRKQAETRRLLKYAGARFTAGFEFRDEFPWLDIALTFEGDSQLIRKRQHTSDDLINLVDAVVAAGATKGNIIRRPGDWSARQEPLISLLDKRGIYRRPLVCVHPAAGNATKQWPPRYFADLINALLATHDIDVALVGGKDETEIADAILASIGQRERVHDLVGQLDLDELPYFLDTCALFVGNDSGPKHVAAGLGVPTVGVHSGVVDAREWGPLGESGVAIQRAMVCSPCYRAKPEDCYRGLACLEGLSVAHVVGICRRLLGLAGPSISRKLETYPPQGDGDEASSSMDEL